MLERYVLQTFSARNARRDTLLRRATKQGKWLLYWLHRWLGIVTCVLCVMWFLSGLVMLYVPFPSWSDEERIASLPVVATERVAVTPDAALSAAEVTTLPSTFRLEMFAGEPVYRIVTADGHASISAVTGARVADVNIEKAQRHLASVFPSARAELLETLDYDQWTPTRRFDAHRPLYKFALNDGHGSVAHVSSQTGEIVQFSTRSERFWNWLGSVPHWIYFTPVRKEQELWRQAVMWLSAPAVIGAITGIWIGILRMRVRKRYSGGRITPYRGWMKWHHVSGLIGGLFVTTWLASGWLSVTPFQLFMRTQLSEAQLAAYAGWTPGSSYGATGQSIARAAQGEATEIAFSWVGGRPYMIARNGKDTLLAAAGSGEPARFDDVDLVQAARGVFPSAAVVDAQRLTDEDVYWYSHHATRPLPIVRVRFDDAASTWLFLDPATGAIAGLRDRSARTYRWLFNFVHDYDLPILLRNQPARDIVVWLLSIVGLVVSASGVVIGYRVLKR
ncbi:Optional hypothetical component of the B12 transporter BtuN [Hyphomicrobium sulfonivorans]|uniref:Optional hypothetical component of the B12 transporter BtuN n=1 Tax=Hyphomicrobium sulfonivorans TaxID=121290 RepID=A0A109BIU2_HYPSL|nr:PepSY domain-containing protein [Hyphomicrobium sulfonivorans]KWT69459.1 Optional hypothetical component of the B12 transporter BtuN [Hyphomicrobium sulfonivorans]